MGRLPDLATTRLPQVFELERAADIADQEFLRVLVGEAAAGIAAELRQRFLELLVGDAKGTQRRRIGRDAVLAHFAAHRDDLRHAGNGEQARAHHEVGDLAHAHGRDAFRRRHRDEQDLAHDGIDRAHLRSRVGRELALHEREPLGDLLAVAEDFRAPGKLDIDDRKPDARDRAHAGDAGQPVHLGFDRIGDELLDLLRRQALGFGHDGDRRPVEIGEHIDGQPRGGQRAEDDEHGGGDQHEYPVLERVA